MYGVLVCPRCRRAKGVRATQRTTRCACGLSIPVRVSGFRARVDRVADLPGAVRAVAAAIADGPVLGPRPRRRSREVHVRVAAGVRGDRRGKILAAAEGLTREVVLFTREDLDRVLHCVGVGDVDGALEALRRDNLLVEPRPGYFRVIV
jgi:hypothetical protein